MVNIAPSIYSLSAEKTAKKPKLSRKQVLAHTLPKESHGGRRNEKGVSKYFLFAGLDVNGAASWSANEVQTIRQFETVRTNNQ
jgi:hypothetical protein